MSKNFETIQDVLEHVAAFAKDSYDGFLSTPLSDRFAFHRAPATGEHRGDPMVLVLGNHSSGKSTFINHMLGQEVQRTGLAPIDDGFTVLSCGAPDEKDGHAVVNNPEFAFGDLEKLGPKFLSHLKMRCVDSKFLKGLCLVDTPGMIDAADGDLGRGYDFEGAVRWFVDRADVVLMLFDPDKPGTTGETLKMFTSALLDVDHKLLIVLNKMDQFRTLRDFARAYGALCWNLSKIIPQKDLPMIYNTYVPVEGAPESALPLEDFAEAREEVIGEIGRAPARRIDNILTRINEHARRLRVQAKVCTAAYRKVRAVRFQFIAMAVCALILAGAASYLTMYLNGPWYAWLSVAAGGVAAAAGLYYFGKWQARSRGDDIISGLTSVFESVYRNDLILSGGADDLRALWGSVRERTVQALRTLGIDAVKPMSGAEEKRLNNLIEKEVPALRAEIHTDLRKLGDAAREAEAEKETTEEETEPVQEEETEA